VTQTQPTDWQEVGRQAHAAGLRRLPTTDPAVFDAIMGLPVGGGAVPIMSAWTAGWDAANLAPEQEPTPAPVQHPRRRCYCGRPVNIASSLDGIHCAEHDLPVTGTAL